MGQTYRDPVTGKLVYYPTNALTDDIYNQYLAYRNSYDPKTGGPDTYTNMSQKTGIDSGLLRDAVERYQTAQMNGEVADPYGLNAMSSTNYNSLANEPGGVPSWAQYDPHGNPIGQPSVTPSVSPVVQGTSPIPTQTRPGRAMVQPGRSASDQTRFSATRNINPYNYNQIGQSVQQPQNILASTAQNLRNSGVIGANYPNTMVPLGANTRRGMTAQVSPTVVGNNYNPSTTTGATNLSNNYNVGAMPTNSASNRGSSTRAGMVNNNASGYSPVYSTAGNSAPTMGTGTTNSYNPTPWSTSDNSNGFLNSSGGFAYDMMPGMFNYLMKYLGGGMNESAGNSSAMNSFTNNAVTSGYPSGMSQYLQNMTGYTGSGQSNYGTGMQNAAAGTMNNLANGQTYQTDLQRQVGNVLSGLINGSGLSDAYVSAMNRSVLQPGLQNLEGELNRMGGGVVAPTSGLQMELKSDMMGDFNNQLIKSGFENLNNFLSQATQSEGQNFNQTLNTGTLQGNLGNAAISNSLNATAQGNNLLNNYLNAANQAQSNQNQYTLGLANQYGNLTSDYLKAYLADQAIKNQNKQASNSSLGSGLASILSSLLGGKSGSTGSNGGSGASGNISSLWDGIKKIFGIGDDPINLPVPNINTQDPVTGLQNIVGDVPTNDIDLYNLLNEITGGSGEYWAGNVNMDDWLNLLGNSGFSNQDTPVDWGNLFGTSDINNPASDDAWSSLLGDMGFASQDSPIDWGGSLVQSQPSTYQYYQAMYPYEDWTQWV